MKKVLAMVLAVFMLVSVLCVGVSADESAPAFVADNVSVSAGGTVDVAIRTQNNPGIVGMRLAIAYDASVLTPTAMAEADFVGATFGPLTNPLSVLWVDAIHPDVTEDGAICVITFQVAEDAAPGTYPVTLSIVDPEDIFNAAFQTVTFGLIDGSVTVIDFIPGDVDGNGTVNVRDLGRLQQYLNGFDVTINEQAANVTGDSSINVRDYGLLQQYLNGWDVNLGGGNVTPPDQPVDPNPPVDPQPPVDPIHPESSLASGVPFKFGMIQGNVSATDVYYLAGGMAQTYYFATTTDVNASIDVYVEAVGDGYYLYTQDEKGTKTFINMVVSDDGAHVNGVYGATAYTIYTYDSEANTLIAEVDGVPYWFGTRNDKTYTTVGPCKTEYEGFYCQVYPIDDIGGGDEPVDPPVDPDPDVPVEGGATLDFGDKANRVSYSTEQQVWAQNGITVTNDKGASTSDVGDYGGEGYPVRFYKNSSVLIMYKGMTKIEFNVDDYKETYVDDLAASIIMGNVSVDGLVVTVTFESPVDSLFIDTLVAQVRVDSITVYGEGGDIGGGDEPVDPNPDVPVVPEPDVPVDPEPDMPVEGSASIDFGDKANRVSYSAEQQVWAQNGITVTNDKAASTSNVGDYGGEGYPVRFYKSSSVLVEAANMTKIVFNCDDYKATYADDLAASITDGTVSVDGMVVTVTFDAPVDSLFIAELAAQVRVDSIQVEVNGGNGDNGGNDDNSGSGDNGGNIDSGDNGGNIGSGDNGGNIGSGDNGGNSGNTPSEPEVPVIPSEPSGDLTVDDAPVAGTAYKFGMIQGNVSASDVYYLAGGMAQTYYLATTTDANAAIDVYLEDTEGGYYLYTLSGSTKTYINMVVSGTHVNGAYEAAASTVYTFDTESYTLIADVDGVPYWFGTRNDKTYTTVGPCKTEYEGFYCQLYA